MRHGISRPTRAAETTTVAGIRMDLRELGVNFAARPLPLDIAPLIAFVPILLSLDSSGHASERGEREDRHCFVKHELPFSVSAAPAKKRVGHPEGSGLTMRITKEARASHGASRPVKAASLKRNRFFAEMLFLEVRPGEQHGQRAYQGRSR